MASSDWPVILLSAIALIETVVVTLALARRGPPSLVVRAGVALILLVPLAAFLSMWVMHSPEFYMFHLVWLYLLVVISFAAFVVGVVSTIVRTHQRSQVSAAQSEEG